MLVEESQALGKEEQGMYGSVYFHIRQIRHKRGVWAEKKRYQEYSVQQGYENSKAQTIQATGDGAQKPISRTTLFPGLTSARVGV